MRAFFLPSIASAIVLASSVTPAAPILPITTAPVIVNSSATTRPASINVLITPFKAMGDSDKDSWISQAIDEELTGDLSRNPVVHVLQGPAGGAAENLALARQQNAQRLVVGNYQTVDDQIRISGEVIDPSDGKSVAQLKVTGVKHDLFKLEDSLAAELEHVLPGAEPPDMSFTVTPVGSDGLNQQQPQVVYQAPDDNASQYPYSATPLFDSGYYGDGFDYGAYGDFGYPFIYGSFFGYGGGRYRNGGNRNHLVGGGPIIHSPYGTMGESGTAFAPAARGFGGGGMGAGHIGGGGGEHR